MKSLALPATPKATQLAFSRSLNAGSGPSGESASSKVELFEIVLFASIDVSLRIHANSNSVFRSVTLGPKSAAMRSLAA
jgi:hypothetical protein